MFLYKLSNTFLYAIGGMLELYTFSLIENCCKYACIITKY